MKKTNRLLALSLSLSISLSPMISLGYNEPFERLSGESRYKTAITLSNKAYSSAKEAIVANGNNYVDALSGSTLGEAIGGPILLVGKDSVPEETIKELKRLGVKKVNILGGTGVISDRVLTKLYQNGFQVLRIAGNDRYETSQKIMEEVQKRTSVSGVVITSNEADAVASSGYRGKNMPLLLVNKYRISDYVKSLKIKKTVLGGEGSISKTYYKAIGAIDRIAGSNRYATAVALAKKTGYKNVAIVNGQNFVDAFTSGGFVNKTKTNILLSTKDVMPSETRAYIDGNKPGKIYVIGGENSISSSIFKAPSATTSTGSKKITEPKEYAQWNKYNNYSESIIMTQDQIKAFNIESYKSSPNLKDILNTSIYVSGSFVKNEINKLSNSSSASNVYGTNINLAGVKNQVTGRYAVVTDRTLIRTFPTWNKYGKGGNYNDFFAETAINPWTAVMVIHESKDNRWAFVMSDEYNGWIDKSFLAFAPKAEIQKYHGMSRQVVAERQLIIGGKKFDMGYFLPRSGESVLVPNTNSQGELVATSISIPSGTIHGYLEYSKANMVRIALKFLGEQYGWGGSRNGHDCSSFVQDVHRVFGIVLPRNTSWQEYGNIGKKRSLSGMSRGAKENTINGMNPMTALYMPGHTMLYLGKGSDGNGYMIHQYASHVSNGKMVVVNKCAITRTSLGASGGGNYLDYTRSAIEFVR